MLARRATATHRPAGRRSARHWPLAVVAILLLVGAVWLITGCGAKTGVTQEVVVDEALGAAAVTDVELSMGAGTLTIAPGAVGLASGTIRYNVEPWEPKIIRSDKSLVIKQGSQKGLSGVGTRVVNDWDLELGRAPMRLKISAGAYEGSYDLSGLTLQDLTITDGAAKSEVVFNSVNPGQMGSFDYKTGASTVTLIGLANANFKSMEFEGGAGTYSLDFSGQLRSNGNVRVKIGAGSVRITVPGSTATKLVISGSLNDIDTEGTWTVSGSTYSTPKLGTVRQDKILSIDLEMNVGSVTLVAE
jgi:hypothetical protein